MDALNHADQMRLANLINDNSDDAEIQKKLDQVVELTSSTRDQAAVALHDCHYDVEKAVDMILENGHAIIETQWKSAGKKKNKNNTSSQMKAGAHAGSHHQNQHHQQQQQQQHHHHNQNQSSSGSAKNHHHHGFNNKQTNHATGNTGPSSNSNSGTGGNHQASSHHHKSSDHHTNKNTNQAATSTPANQFNNNNNLNNNNINNNNINAKQDASDSLKNLVGISSSNLMYSSDTNPNTNKSSTSLQQPQQQQLQRSTMHQATNRQQDQQPRPTRIPDSAVEMPSELQVSSLNVQFGELDLREGQSGETDDAKGAFQDVLESNRLGRQPGLPNSHSAVNSQDNKSNRNIANQQHLGKGAPRRQYNHNNNDDRRFYTNQNRGGRQISGNSRPHNQRSGPMNNNNPRGVRTIMNRGPSSSNHQPLSTSNSNQASGGFPNSIDTWTNSTAEAATKPSNSADQVNVGGTLRVGQWSDVTGNEDWSEEDWEAKVMETKVFTPTSKAVDLPPSSQKNQPLLSDPSVPPQINLASKLSDNNRDDLAAQQATLNTGSPQAQSQQTSQNSISHMNNIFDASVAKVLEQQNLTSIKPKTSIGMSQYQKEPNDTKNVLDQHQNLSNMKPKTTMNINQYNKEASESLKSLVGISSAKGGVPSVPPGALPIMSQPQYIMGNYQPAIFPYAYQTPDVHYQVAAQNAGREQNFQSVYSPNDANKFNRGTDGDAPSISTTQAAPVASQTPNQAFVTNALHAGYPLTYAMPGAFNMMPQNLYSAAPIFPHIPQPNNTGSANNVYQKNTTASYQHHTGYSGYDHPLIQDYVKQQQQNYTSSASMQQQQPTTKSSIVNSELDVSSAGPNSYNMYGSINKSQTQANKQNSTYNDTKSYQQQMSAHNQQQQYGFSPHNVQQQPTSLAGYPLLQGHNLDNTNLNAQANNQQQQLQQHNSSQRAANQVNSSKYYSWNQ